MGKANWTRLADMVRKQGGDTRFMYPRFERLFLDHHKNATEIILSDNGQVMAAVYLTPNGQHEDWFRKLMAELQERFGTGGG